MVGIVEDICGKPVFTKEGEKMIVGRIYYLVRFKNHKEHELHEPLFKPMKVRINAGAYVNTFGVHFFSNARGAAGWIAEEVRKN
jgi:hypothetical protein